MKRRLFLRSLWLQGIALPTAYLLPSVQGPLARATTDTSGVDNNSDATPGGKSSANAQIEAKGCGRNADGAAKQAHGFVPRDFHDPYLELIRLLKEASEIEHSLMIQYIYAAFSLKPKYRALVGAATPTSDGLLSIAIQEMQHLAVVNKLLVALGSSPNLGRQDFPYEPDIYPFPLSLERLSRQSLARYTYVEAGKDSIPLTGALSAADQLLCDSLTAELGTDTGLNHVAGLYAIIIEQLQNMLESGILQLEDSDVWIDKLSHIMIEGEREHFRFFRQLFLGEHPAFAGQPNPWNLAPDHPDYPSFPVQTNPSAYPGHANQIEPPQARELAWLSNLHYWMVLMMLDYYYRTGRESMNAMAQAQMIGPLQSLAYKLTEFRTGLPFDVLSIGYAPAADNPGQLKFISRLSAEAAALAKTLKPALPAGYPLDIHTATAELLRLEAE